MCSPVYVGNGCNTFSWVIWTSFVNFEVSFWIFGDAFWPLSCPGDLFYWGFSVWRPWDKRTECWLHCQYYCYFKVYDFPFLLVFPLKWSFWWFVYRFLPPAFLWSSPHSMFDCMFYWVLSPLLHLLVSRPSTSFPIYIVTLEHRLDEKMWLGWVDRCFTSHATIFQ